VFVLLSAAVLKTWWLG